MANTNENSEQKGSQGADTSLVGALHSTRILVKEVAGYVQEVKRTAQAVEWFPARADKGEVLANITLAYRHLEDASMRLGKAIQAADGGVSVYDPRNMRVHLEHFGAGGDGRAEGAASDGGTDGTGRRA